MLETDCPYMTPVPHRGERNHPGFMHLTAEKIAEVRGISAEEVCSAAYKTANSFSALNNEMNKCPPHFRIHGKCCGLVNALFYN